MLKPADIGWMAGLLEGEGWLGVAGKNKKYPNYKGTLYISVNMTDKDVVQRAAKMFGRPMQGPYKPDRRFKNGKMAYRAHVTGPEAAGWLMTIYSQMGKRRRSTIRSRLRVWRKQNITHKHLTASRFKKEDK